jgi:hypothetical protein
VRSSAQFIHYGAGETIFCKGNRVILPYLLKGSQVTPEISHPLRACLRGITADPGEIFNWSTQLGVEIDGPLLEVISARPMATPMQPTNAIAAGIETVSSSSAP